MPKNSLELFDSYTASWFKNALGNPTMVQEEAWPAIAAGEHTLVSAPTGTGKTLSAFLVFIDRLRNESREGTLKKELQLIYVSPLKSLAGDIRENLRRPLNGILNEELKNIDTSRSTPSDLNIAIRTGDTPQNERRKMITSPPHILITTPESLYLMLTSKSGKSILRTAKAIIIDELHAIIDSKRGAHLMLSIARLDKLCQEPLQRIGLSATIEPLSLAAEYLSPEPVTIVSPKMNKTIKIKVTSPLADTKVTKKDTIWQELAMTVYEHCKKTRSVIAFVDGRMYAEKLAYYVNQLGEEGFAKTHHGSLSKEQRFEVEHALRDGSLRLLCATSSMELGIDVGDIDQVLQIGCPRTISSTMQRLGRAGHNPGRTSVMHIFPRTASEGLYCGLTAKIATSGGVEYSKPPKLCLDILAQHLVSMANGESYDLEEVMKILCRAYPFYEVTIQDVRDVLCMLAGDYEHERDIPVRPRILYDRIHERVEGDTYSRMLAVSAGGTIPDKGLYSVKTENGVKLGELDEEYVFEARIGDKFLLGAFSWQIKGIQKDAVIVTQSNSFGARPPFWKGEISGRRLKTGIAFGSILRKLNHTYENDSKALTEVLYDLGLDEKATRSGVDYLKRQFEATGVLPDDKTILIEHFHDETGNHQMMVHSVFGRQVNAPFAILTREIAKRHANTNINYFDDDDGFLLFPFGICELPDGLLQEISPKTARKILEALVPSTPLFNMTFRYNVAHALMMGVKSAGRQPLWVQRIRSTEMLDSIIRHEEHPLIRETKRECLEDYWDLDGVEYVLNGIQSGIIKVREMFLEKPSPMSLPLRNQTEASFMYDYAPTTLEIQNTTIDAMKQVETIPPTPTELARVSERIRMPKDEKELHSLLMIEGDFMAGEIDVPVEWLETLAIKGQADYIEPGVWIPTEQMELYREALIESNMEARIHIVRRMLRYHGAKSLEQIGERYLWTDEVAKEIISALLELRNIVENDGLYYHAEIYNRAQRETIKSRRRQIKTLPSERYSALLTNRLRISAQSKEQLEHTINLYCDQVFDVSLWETVLFPTRVSSYRTELLDSLLSEGNYCWKITPSVGLSFHHYEEINWDTDLSKNVDILEGNEKIIYEALLKRGASFVQRLQTLIEGVSPHDVLLALTQKGLVCADSFVPIRQWLGNEKAKKSTIKQRVNARVMAMRVGRWEVSRPLTELTIEQQLNRIFDRVVILSRETIVGMSWSSALEILRVWEYTGRVRRGYFIEGLSGIQFIREKDFTSTMLELEEPRKEIVWLSAIDPSQPYGKCLAHREDRSFLNVPGTAVALQEGVPIAVFERQGKILRVFEEMQLNEVLIAFSIDFERKRLFPTLNRIVVKEYPKEAVDALKNARFSKEMLDYVLYRR